MNRKQQLLLPTGTRVGVYMRGKDVMHLLGYGALVSDIGQEPQIQLDLDDRIIDGNSCYWSLENNVKNIFNTTSKNIVDACYTVNDEGTVINWMNKTCKVPSSPPKLSII